MKRNKVVEIILSLITKVKIKDKRIKYTVIAVLSLLLGAATQIEGLEGIIEIISPSQGIIEGAVKEGVVNASEGIIEGILNSLF